MSHSILDAIGNTPVVEIKKLNQICAKMIINAGINKIYYRSGYTDQLSQDMIQEANIELIHLDAKQQGEEP